MGYAVFALFEDHEKADSALAKMRNEDIVKLDDVGVLIHENGYDLGQPDSNAESHMGPGVRRGALLGAIVGAAAGILVGGPAGLIAAGPLAGAIMGAGSGGVAGALGGGLYGAGQPDPQLEHLAEQLRAGKVLVTLETHHKTTADVVERIAKDFGATVEHKRI